MVPAESHTNDGIVPAESPTNDGIVPAESPTNVGIVPAESHTNDGIVPAESHTNDGIVPAESPTNVGIVPAPLTEVDIMAEARAQFQKEIDDLILRQGADTEGCAKLELELQSLEKLRIKMVRSMETDISQYRMYFSHFKKSIIWICIF